MLQRVLEPEVMDTPEEARAYNAMDHSEVNRRFVDDFLAAGPVLGEVLDLGTGTALIPIELCQREPQARVLAIDLSVAMLDLARGNVEIASLTSQIMLDRVDGKGLPYADGRFAAVMSNSIVHHIPEPLGALGEAWRVLAPGGLIFIRDLLRPQDDAAVSRLVELYAADATPHQRQLFDDSLRAALSLDEIRALVADARCFRRQPCSPPATGIGRGPRGRRASSELCPVKRPIRVGGLYVEPNMLGAYGPWAAGIVGEEPARMSFRQPRYNDLEAWRTAARGRLKECLLQPDAGGVPQATVQHQFQYDGLEVEHLSWQLPYGPPTEAVFLKPAGAKGPLPAVLALHDHGGNKYFGTRKITQISEERHPMMARHQERYYGGVAWANELAKRGYAVLVHDTFAFASRRVRAGDLPAIIKGDLKEAQPEIEAEIEAYNRFAGGHEHLDVQEPALRRHDLAGRVHGRGPAGPRLSLLAAAKSMPNASAVAGFPAAACAPFTSRAWTSGSPVPAAPA